MLASVALGAGFYFLIILLLANSQTDNPDFYWRNFGPGVSNVRQLGFYGLTLAGISAGMLANTSNLARRVCWLTLLTLGLWLSYLSGSRAAFGAAAIALSLLIFLTPREQRFGYSLKILACAALAAPLSYILVPDPLWGLSRIFGDIVGTSPGTDFSTGRYEMWVETTQSIGQNPLFGHGEGQFRFSVEIAGEKFNHPHNSILQFLYQWGLAGTIALALLAFQSLKSLLQRVTRGKDVNLPALGSACALVAMSTLEGSLYHIYPTMIVLLGFAVLASAPEAGEDIARSAVESGSSQ